MIQNKVIRLLVDELKIESSAIIATLNLLQQENTVPFIARYRKSETGNLDEEQIEAINVKYKYFHELEKRKEAIKEILKEKGLLTQELLNEINNTQTKANLEAIYEPYKLNKKTKASVAIELGLEPLAKEILNNTNKNFNPYYEAKKFINDKITNIEFAIEQASYIISQIISQDISTRNYVKKSIEEYGKIVSKIKKNAIDENQTFKNYYNFSCSIRNIKSYQVMAISRAESLKILSYSLEYYKAPIIHQLNNKYFKIPTTGKIIHKSLIDALERLIFPSIEREIKNDLFDSASKNAIKQFSDNLEGLLLSPVLKNKRILAIDPGFVSGCKIAIIDEIGKLLNVSLINITKRNLFFNYEKDLLYLIKKYNINQIVIGNGTASNETVSFIREFLIKNYLKIDLKVVSEVGASVYSASKIAIEEFPNLSVEQRSAINIARRFQDPLNELVKIDPKSLGIGQYQHDVDQKELKQALDFKILKVVNQVGVEVNSASKAILSHISGITPNSAQKIIDYIKQNGQFQTRADIKKVKGISKKAYQQAIGFLRISDSPYYFDRTFVHPETYHVADNLIKIINLDLNNIDKELVKKIDAKLLAQQLNSNEQEVQFILDSLIFPYRDVRENKYIPNFKMNINDINDIKIENEYEGIIKNITDFGVFIYFGFKINAFINNSYLSLEIRNDSRFKTEAIVNIKIVNIEPERKRIQAMIKNFIDVAN
ncbi:Tex-like N-terminal domain-containing protein [Mycoplasma phocimorsus]|uniref:Tex-like N-terminal domain-containing protein n=1 Tax=Mycoplasma phocimorsus TaxID=3045839 RepID=UPI0024C06ACC|nr:Tex-like N-terminal domain-containing protein [Mycoplasma phocimorsus]MDJ1648471.1 Tex-like N-terminal domain-containing protein [Mycoplasma phocimorsus]